MILRILGGILIVGGLLLCVTIMLAPVGVPMLLIGLLMVAVGRKRKIIVEVQGLPSQNN